MFACYARMGRPFMQIRQSSIISASLWRTYREKTFAHGSFTQTTWKDCARSARGRSRVVSLLKLSNESLEKTVTIAGFLSATIPFTTSRGTLFGGMRLGQIL